MPDVHPSPAHGLRHHFVRGARARGSERQGSRGHHLRGASTVTIEASIVGLRLDLAAGFARPERYANMARTGTSRPPSSGSPGAGRPREKRKGAMAFHDQFSSSYKVSRRLSLPDSSRNRLSSLIDAPIKNESRGKRPRHLETLPIGESHLFYTTGGHRRRGSAPALHGQNTLLTAATASFLASMFTWV